MIAVSKAMNTIQTQRPNFFFFFFACHGVYILNVYLRVFVFFKKKIFFSFHFIDGTCVMFVCVCVCSCCCL